MQTEIYNAMWINVNLTRLWPVRARVDISYDIEMPANLSYNQTAYTKLEMNYDYEGQTQKANLEISKDSIVGITFSDKTFTYDGVSKSLSISGKLPLGTSVSYTSNVQTEAGVY